MSVDQAREEWQAAGDYDSACRLIRAQAARIGQLERELADFKASQNYRYIGVDGKPVLARELEDRAIKAERELAGARQLVFASGVELGKAEAELVAEKALADQIGAQLKIAESALSDIGDAEREDGDDLKWCERRAAKAIPSTRAALAAYRKARGL